MKTYTLIAFFKGQWLSGSGIVHTSSFLFTSNIFEIIGRIRVDCSALSLCVSFRISFTQICHLFLFKKLTANLLPFSLSLSNCIFYSFAYPFIYCLKSCHHLNTNEFIRIKAYIYNQENVICSGPFDKLGQSCSFIRLSQHFPEVVFNGGQSNQNL